MTDAERALERIETRLNEMYSKLFTGNGEPSIVSRVVKLEVCGAVGVWILGALATAIISTVIYVWMK